MNLTGYIVWTADPDLAHFLGLTIRWYGLLFALGFLISQQILFYIFRSEGHKEQDVETLTIYMVIATILGARLGHVFFYEPARYLANPIDILKIWEGGLASHGAAIGILFALYVYSSYDIKLSRSKDRIIKKPRPGQSYLWVVDRIVIVVALTGCLIRFGNFMNSEIVGIPTHSDYGVVFARHTIDALQNSSQAVEEVDVHKSDQQIIHTENQDMYFPVEIAIRFANNGYAENEIKAFIEGHIGNMLSTYSYVTEDIYQPVGQALNYDLKQEGRNYVATIYTSGIPRHPAQLYESFSCLLLFFFLLYLWSRKKSALPEGKLLGIFLIVVFGLRFFYEFFKEDQVDWEATIPLNMGQWLSIPLVMIGIWLLLRVQRTRKHKV